MTLRRLAVGAFLFLLTRSPSLAGPYDDCFKLNDEAGIGACSYAIQLSPRDSDLYSNRGYLYLQKGDLDRAFADYTKAIELNPRSVDSHSGLGSVHQLKGDLDRAIASFSKAIELNPRKAEGHLGLGKALQDKGDYDRAIISYSKAIELQPNNDDAYNSRCWTRAVANRDLPLGLADCDNAIRLKPGDANNYDSRGFIFMMLNRLDDAIADYNSALRIDPRLAESLYGRGIAKRRKGDEAGASEDLALAASIKSSIAEEYSRYGLK